MTNAGRLLCLVTLFTLTCCVGSQNTSTAVGHINGSPVGSISLADTSLAPSADDVAQTNLNKADSACTVRFPSQKGYFYQQKACYFAAYKKYALPFQNDSQKLIVEEEESNLLAAAKEVDNGSMTISEYVKYHLICHTILAREIQEATELYDRQGQESALKTATNYDTEYGNEVSLSNDRHDLSILHLNDAEEELSDDRDRYEYCAGLNSENLRACDPEKMIFQTDLSTYRALASSSITLTQANSETSSDAQQQDIQDDLDAIAGGVVP